MKKKDNSIYSFWMDKATRDNVYNYLMEFLKEEAVKELFDEYDDAAKNAYQIAEAKKIIDRAWENMDLLFQTKRSAKDNINQAR